MDTERGSSFRGTIPRLSRLPKPRASQDSLKLARPGGTATIHSDGVSKNSQPLHLSSISSSRTIASIPLGENTNEAIKSRYGWNNQSLRIRNHSPVRDALQATQSTFLETTPPTLNGEIPVFVEGNENINDQSACSVTEVSKAKHRRRARPSLSDRTAETLSQVSPSPSPTRRRQSDLSRNTAVMGPPTQPASVMRNSRPNTPSLVRSEAAATTKQRFRPPGRSSPTKDYVNTVLVPSPGSIHTPPRAFVRDKNSRLTGSLNDRRSSFSNATHEPVERKKLSSQTMKSRVMNQDVSQRTKQARPHIESLFRNPPQVQQPTNGLAISNLEQVSSLLRPRSRGENPLASASKKTSSTPGPKETPSEAEPINSPSAKSSAALRQAIAAAKAARKTGGTSKLSEESSVLISSFGGGSILDDNVRSIGSSTGLLQKRIDVAVSTGQLNIAAMGFQNIPDEVMVMYEPGQSSIAWAEMVDLSKLNAADNKIEHLSNEMFPDWSIEQLADDDEKNNQFAGLQAFDFHNNLLSEIPIGFRRLGMLTMLNLSGNKLTTTSLEVIWQIPNLKELNLANNYLKGHLSFERIQCQSLQVLDLHGNQIETLSNDLLKLSSLQILNLSQNRLQLLPWPAFANMPLIDLNVANNRLSGVLIQGNCISFDALRSFDVSNNAIEVLCENDVTFPKLQKLCINANKLKSFPDMSNWQELITLSMSDNQLRELPENISAARLLKHVDISQNNVKGIDPRVCKLEHLTMLNLAGNPLRDRKYLTMDTAKLKLELEKRLAPSEDATGVTYGSDAFADRASIHASQGTEGVQYIYVPSKGVLDLSSQSLTSVDLSAIDLVSGGQIHTVRLSNNDFTSFPHELLSHASLRDTLRTLNLSHNPMLHPTAYLSTKLYLPALQSLNIVSTGLTSLDTLTEYLHAPSLRELNISCHRLSGPLPVLRTSFPALTTLLATDNWFSSVNVEAARGLEVLDIRNNEIDSLPAHIGLLGNLPSTGRAVEGRLRVFECSGNKFRVPRLAVIDKGTEAILKDLRRMVPSQDVPEEWVMEM